MERRNSMPVDFIFKVVMLAGNKKDVGKTSLLTRMVRGTFPRSEEAKGDISDYECLGTVIDYKNKKCRLSIEIPFKGIGSETYQWKGVSAVIVVYDVTNTNSFEEVPHWLEVC
eukprot:TRINITY_DN1480_c0_g1_i1.p1 TRINITY_DN1480_c0_g1~~TRINITY_DN1480_c0_g1_i1.p1  ORF type:complete len:113 (-),score=11.21 TRINITY_DN1480_c0_g1_i1:532-870(-)